MSNRARTGRIVLAMLVLLTPALLITLTEPATTFACSCPLPQVPAGGWSREALVQESDVVFRGRVTAKSAELVEDGLGYYLVTFQVSEYWKGPVEDPFVVRTANHSGICGLAQQVGEEWLIYASQDAAGKIRASTCSRSSWLPGGPFAADLAVLGPGTPPRTPEQPTATGSGSDNGTPWNLVVGATLALLALTAIFTIAMRRAWQR